jgi:hypothetical protein
MLRRRRVNVTFPVELGYDGPPLDPSATYEVTYEIKGGGDPLINTLTVSGENYSVDEEEFICTTFSDAELVAAVLEVSEF